MKKRLKALIFPIKVLVTLCIFGALFHYSQLDFKLLTVMFSTPFSLLLIVLLCYMMVLFHTWRWYRLNQAQNVNLSFWRTLSPTYVGIALNNVLPGSIGGDVFRLYFVLKTFPNKKSATLLSLLTDRVTGLLGLLVLATVVSPLYLESYHDASLLKYVFMGAGTILLIVSTASLVVYALLSDKVGMARRLQEYFAKSHVADKFLSIVNALHAYRNSKLVLLESIVMSMLTQILLIWVSQIICHSMNIQILPFGVCLLALVIAQIANLLPLTPGGIGIGETAFANVVYLIMPGSVAPYATVFLALRLVSSLSYFPGAISGLTQIHWQRKPSVNISAGMNG